MNRNLKYVVALLLAAAVAIGQDVVRGGTTVTGTAPVTVTSGVVSMTAAGAGVSGYLTNSAGVLAVDSGFVAQSGAFGAGGISTDGGITAVGAITGSNLSGTNTGDTSGLDGGTGYSGCASALYSGALCNVGNQLVIDGGLIVAPVAAEAVRITAGSITWENGSNDWLLGKSAGTDQNLSLLAGASTYLSWNYATGVTNSPYGYSSTVASGGIASQRLTGAKNCAGTSGTDCDVSDGTNRTFTGAVKAAQVCLEDGGACLGDAAASGWACPWDGGACLGSVTDGIVSVTSACTAPTITHGTARSFQMDVGTSCSTIYTVVLALPVAPNGWHCSGYNKSRPPVSSGVELLPSGDTTNSATLVSVSSTLAASDFLDGNDLVISCAPR